MKLHTIQWNIGGAHIRLPDDDPTKAASYVNKDLSYIIEYLKNETPDIITLQESHADQTDSQAQEIGQQLGLPYVINDPYDNSHIDPTQKLCQSIISRYPILHHSFSFFYNPHYRTTNEDGSVWGSHDKGVSTVLIDIKGIKLTVQTLHLIPFRKFNADMDDDEGRKVKNSIELLLEKETSPYLLQGDFNFDDIPVLLPNIFENELHENGGQQATTPKGRIYDHIFYRGLQPDIKARVDTNVNTDHYPVHGSFTLE